MSDKINSGVGKPVPPVPLELMEAHIADKGADSPCEACGQKDWLVFTGPNLRGCALSAVDGTGFTTLNGQNVPVMPVMCKNCGCLRLFVTGLILPGAFEDKTDG